MDQLHHCDQGWENGTGNGAQPRASLHLIFKGIHNRRSTAIGANRTSFIVPLRWSQPSFHKVVLQIPSAFLHFLITVSLGETPQPFNIQGSHFQRFQRYNCKVHSNSSRKTKAHFLKKASLHSDRFHYYLSLHMSLLRLLPSSFFSSAHGCLFFYLFWATMKEKKI